MAPLFFNCQDDSGQHWTSRTDTVFISVLPHVSFRFLFVIYFWRRQEVAPLHAACFSAVIVSAVIVFDTKPHLLSI